MSGASVLTAVANYLQSGVGTIPHLADVLANPPKFVNKSAFYEGPIPAGAPSGALIWLWLGPQYSERMDLMGHAAGGKMYYYDLHLQCVLMCTAALAERADQENRAFVDGLTTWIEADKNAANPNVIFQWGEGKVGIGGPDLHFESGWPRVSGTGSNATTHVYTKGTVTVCEYHGPGT